jgi:Fur family ferric uptake transcriptional regulator
VPRNTPQRQAIRDALQQANRPLSPHEVLAGAQGEVPRLGIATVYRTLKELTQEGWLVAVELPGEPQRWEVAGKGHHHHFSCEDCGKVFELRGCPPNLGLLVPPGFTMQRHEVFIYGHCRECGGGR